jgi:hypothetical protein
MNWHNKLGCYYTHAVKSYQGQRLYLIGPIRKLRRKLGVLNSVTGMESLCRIFVADFESPNLGSLVKIVLPTLPLKPDLQSTSLT